MVAWPSTANGLESRRGDAKSTLGTDGGGSGLVWMGMHTHRLQWPRGELSHQSPRPQRFAELCSIARADAALYLRFPSPTRPDYREKIWDHAAGALIVGQAGDGVTDLGGQPSDLASEGIVHRYCRLFASNGALHTAVLQAIAHIQE
jgi:hypothetical protein